MIVTLTEDSRRYDAVHAGLARALAWLRDADVCSLAKGRQDIGEGITVSCEEPTLLPREKVSLEAHRRYIDIHVPVKGTETIGWAPVASMRHPRAGYDAERDVIFYGDAATSLLHLHVGQIAIFFPDDAHAPNIGLGNHRKLCIKIPV